MRPLLWSLPFVALVTGVAWLLGSEAGLHFALTRAGAALGGGFEVAVARGTLAGPLELEGVTLDLGPNRITVEQVRIDLRLLPALIGRLQLIDLDAAGVTVTVTPDPAAPRFELPDRLDLPVHVALERVTLRGLELRIGERPPLRFATLSGAASADARGLRLDGVELSSATARVAGSLEVGTARPFPVTGALRATLQHAATRAQIEVGLGGRLEALTISVASAAPLAAHAEFRLDDLFGSPHMSGALRCDEIALDALQQQVGALAGTTLDCDLALTSADGATRATGRLDIKHPAFRPASLEIVLRATSRVVELERGTLSFDGAALRATLRGRIAIDRPGLPYTVTADAREIQAPTATPSPVIAHQARLEIAGDLTILRAQLTAGDGADGTLVARATYDPPTHHSLVAGEITDWALPGAGLRVSDGRFSAAGDAARVDLELGATLRLGELTARLETKGRHTPEATVLAPLSLALLGGRIDGEARLVHAAKPQWSALFRARDLDPGVHDARFPGRVAARIRIDGDRQRTNLVLDELSGQLRERRLGGSIRLSHGVVPSLDSFALQIGGSRVAAATTASGLRFELEAPDLADLLPEARGRLSSSGELARDLTGSLRLEADAVTVGKLRVAKVRGTATVPPTGPLAAWFALEGLAAGDLAADALTLVADGQRNSARIEIAARRDGATMTLGAQGALSADGFAGMLERLEFVPQDLPRWTLAAATALRIGRNGVAVTEACLAAATARGCLRGSWHPLAAWRLQGHTEGLPATAFRNLLPRALDYRGTLALEFAAVGHGPVLGASHASLVLSAGHIARPARHDQAALTLLEFSGGRIAIEHRAGRLATQVALELGGHGGIYADLVATGPGAFATRQLGGRIRARADHFALLTVLTPELKRLDGRFDADVTVAGTVAAPLYSGRVSFQDGRAALPQLGLDLTELGIEVLGDGAALTISGSARSGGTLNWRANLRRSAGTWRADGRLWGQAVTVFDSPEARIIATPDLQLALDGRDLLVTGEVSVPRARLAPRSMSAAVQSTIDEVMIDAGGKTAESGELQISSRVRLKLGDDVKFEGFGLKANITGEMALTEHPGGLALASGELALNSASYEAYGQRLTVERGRLLFSGGPASNPGLDVRASRSIERTDSDTPVKIGIDVRGTLRRPETTLYSIPAMSSSDALSYLVVGRPLSESTDAENDQLTDAASRMRLSGGEFVAQQVGRRIGLDEVKVTDSGDTAQAQLWLGTYVSPKLFVSYGMGLYEQFHTARVRYQMSRHWSVEAESGRESSADVKYTIER